MKTFSILIALIFTLNGLGQNTFNYQNDFKAILAKSQDPADKLSYKKLLKKFTDNDTTMTDYEVLALMIGFTAKEEYKPYEDLRTEREIYNLNGDGKFNEALTKVNTFLKTHPVSLKSLYEKSYTFHMLNMEDSATFYLLQGRKIIRAMAFSGKSAETAMFALGPADGQDFIRKTAAGKIGVMGSGTDKNGNFLDILEVIPKEGKPYNLYFIIQHATEKMFGGKSLEEELNEQKKKDEKKSGK